MGPLGPYIPMGVFHEKMWQLVSRDGNFFNFRGIILCNAKHLQFSYNKKNNNIGAHFRKSSIPLCKPFLNLWSCCFRLRRKFFPSLRRLHCHFWWLLVKNYFLHKLARVLLSLLSKKSGAPIIIFNVTSMFGYYKQFKFVLNKKICQLYYKENPVNCRIYQTVNQLLMLMELW